LLRSLRSLSAVVGDLSAPDSRDEPRAASEIGMIAYAGKATVVHDDLLGRLALHISVLEAQQTRRAQQAGRLSDHHPDRIQTILTRNQRE
jgi:hypothetical protein